MMLDRYSIFKQYICLAIYSLRNLGYPADAFQKNTLLHTCLNTLIVGILSLISTQNILLFDLLLGRLRKNVLLTLALRSM